MGEYWEDWLNKAALSKGAPVDFIGGPLLSLAGILIARSRRGQAWRGWVEPAIIWTSLIGPPSSGKSPALDAIIEAALIVEEMLNVNHPELERRWETEKLEAQYKREAWQKDVKTAVAENRPPPEMSEACREPDPPHEHRIITNDTSPEELIRLSARNLMDCCITATSWPAGLPPWTATAAAKATPSAHCGARPWRPVLPGRSRQG